MSDKSCRENQNTHFVSSNIFFKNRTVYKIMWKNTVKGGRSQMTILRMRIACWIPKATNTLTLCNTHSFSTTILWLHECASVLRYAYIACLVEC